MSKYLPLMSLHFLLLIGCAQNSDNGKIKLAEPASATLHCPGSISPYSAQINLLDGSGTPAKDYVLNGTDHCTDQTPKPVMCSGQLTLASPNYVNNAGSNDGSPYLACDYLAGGGAITGAVTSYRYRTWNTTAAGECALTEKLFTCSQ